MSAYGYRLAGNAKSMAADYIPSLIGIDEQQTAPLGSDTYFERVDLPDGAVNLTAISITRWVCYDSLPGNRRDPIVAVKAGPLSFYSTLSELVEMITEFGNAEAQEMVALVSRSMLA
jgi:hypothetical protein